MQLSGSKRLVIKCLVHHSGNSFSSALSDPVSIKLCKKIVSAHSTRFQGLQSIDNTVHETSSRKMHTLKAVRESCWRWNLAAKQGLVCVGLDAVLALHVQHLFDQFAPAIRENRDSIARGWRLKERARNDRFVVLGRRALDVRSGGKVRSCSGRQIEIFNLDRLVPVPLICLTRIFPNWRNGQCQRSTHVPVDCTFIPGTVTVDAMAQNLKASFFVDWHSAAIQPRSGRPSCQGLPYLYPKRNSAASPASISFATLSFAVLSFAVL